MERMIVAGCLSILIAMFGLIGTAPEVSAQTVCQPGAVQQADMQGVYVNPDSPMRVEVFQCGGIYVQWIDPLGITHKAVYLTTNRAMSGGVAASGVSNLHGVFLDDSYRLGVKPAEAGFVQVITLGIYDETYRMYRLKKIA